MNRVDRLHAILVHLQSKKRVTAQELADRFGLSLRTVYRDIKALDESGVPVIGEAGIGYSVMEGYRLPPVMFTKEEASSLMMGSKLMQHFTDAGEKRNYDSALFKIKAVLRSMDKEYLEELDERIVVSRGSAITEEEESQPYLSFLRQAIVEKKVVSVVYYSMYKEEITERILEPIGLTYFRQSWHLIAWCRLRNDYRDFRTDRIRKLSLLDEYFDISQHPSLAEYIARLKKEVELTEVVVSFDKEVCRYMQLQKYYFGFVSQQEKGDRVEMKFLTAYLNQFARWMLMFTNAVKILEPAALQDTMQQLVAELKKNYE
ncbi:MAG TPA: YafY family protein [Chitinophagaceae bacterium]|mgnify:CR=1 FL=1|nr:YafY family protein [Chitinophagaceae bacterium]